jgi:CheY-like chemotaxis protein
VSDGAVLVVDDDPTILEMVEIILEGAGHGVCTARNGLEALERVRTDPPPLILLDMMMPVMDGMTFLRRCETEGLCADTRVVAMSAAMDPRAIAGLPHVAATLPSRSIWTCC